MGRITDKRIAVLMGGRSSERENSLRTGQAVHQALLRRRNDVVAIDVSDRLYQDLKEQEIAIAFLSLHGLGGEAEKLAHRVIEKVTAATGWSWGADDDGVVGI